MTNNMANQSNPDNRQKTESMMSEKLPSVSFFAGLVQGGAEMQAVESAKLLHQKGHNVVFYCYNLKAAFYHPENEIRVVDLKNPNAAWPDSIDKLLSILRLVRQIRREQPDYLISFTTLLNVLNGFAGLASFGKSKTLHIGSERNSVLRYTHSRLWRLICRTAYKGLDGLFANNTPAVQQLKTLIKFRPDRTFLLLNILDTSFFKREEGLVAYRPDRFSILVPARICDQKNQQILVPIARHLQQLGVPVLFVLAGKAETEYARILKEQIETEGLQSSFEWLGQTNEIKTLYNRCDLTFLPSKFEGFSNSVIEAMACEALVLGSAISSFTEVIRDQDNGFITELVDPDQIAAKIKAIADLTSGQRRAIGEAARQSVLGCGREGYYENLMNILKQVRQP